MYVWQSSSGGQENFATLGVGANLDMDREYHQPRFHAVSVGGITARHFGQTETVLREADNVLTQPLPGTVVAAPTLKIGNRLVSQPAEYKTEMYAQGSFKRGMVADEINEVFTTCGRNSRHAAWC